MLLHFAQFRSCGRGCVVPHVQRSNRYVCGYLRNHRTTNQQILTVILADNRIFPKIVLFSVGPMTGHASSRDIDNAVRIGYHRRRTKGTPTLRATNQPSKSQGLLTVAAITSAVGQ